MTERRKFLAFVLIGGFSSAVNLGARILFGLVVSYEWSIVLAFPVALTTAFLLNRAFVFDGSTGPWHHQYGRFFIVNLVALAQVFVVSVLFAKFIFPAIGFHWQAETIGHGIGLLSPIVTSYWAHKHFSFAAKRPAPVLEDAA